MKTKTKKRRRSIEKDCGICSAIAKLQFVLNDCKDMRNALELGKPMPWDTGLILNWEAFETMLTGAMNILMRIKNK